MRVPSGPGSAPPKTIRRPSQLRWGFIAALVAIIIAAGYLAYQRYAAAAAPATPPQTYTVRRGNVTSTVTSTGTVAPLDQARLTFSASSRVAEVDVQPGQTVTKGQTLAKLDTTDLALQVSQARANLSSAQAKLAQLKAGSRPEDVKAAQAALAAAQAKLASMQAGGRPESVAQAQAQLDSAKAKLSALVAPPTDADLKADEQAVSDAQAALAKAQADLSTLKTPLPQDVKAAQLAVEKAKDDLWSAQTSRDGVCGHGPGYQCDSANAQVASAQTTLDTANNSLAKLLAPPKPEDLASADKAVSSAQAQLTAAQAKLAQLKAGPDPNQVAQAQADVSSAEQALVLAQKPYTDSDIKAQEQAVAQAQADLALKQAPYLATDIQQAQAAVDQAQAQLDSAQYALANAAMLAPFDGVVNTVGVNPGEIAGSSSTITLVNPKNVRLDLSVDEADIAKVQLGQKSTVTFDDIPGKTFSGQVIAIAPNATLSSGVATYAVSVSLPEPGGIRPGMTGNASIVYGDQQNVLVVPNRAIRTQGRNRVVEVLVNGKPEARTVQVGVSNDTLSEITSGLSEGDLVVVGGTTAAQPRVNTGSPLGGLGAPQVRPVGR